jgi:hypothetical protein
VLSLVTIRGAYIAWWPYTYIRVKALLHPVVRVQRSCGLRIPVSRGDVAGLKLNRRGSMYKVLIYECVCLALKVRPASGLYAFLEAGGSKEHVRSVLLSLTMSGIIVRELQVKRTFSEIIHTN